MKPSKLLTGFFVGAMVAPATLVFAGATGSSIPWLLSASAVGQAGAAPKASAADRQEVDKLLSRARQAMKDGNLDLADSLIGRAEAMKVENGVFHLGDTPKKARHDFDQRRRTTRDAAKLPSARAKPELPNPDQRRDAAPGKLQMSGATDAEPSLNRASASMARPPADDSSALPGMGRSDDALTKSPFARRLAAGPPADGSPEDDIGAAPGKPLALAAGNPEARRRSDALVLAARRAVAQNDLRRAAALVEEAMALGATYGLHEDSPAKVGALVKKAKEIAELRAGQPQSDGARRQYADLLMEQAEQLMRYKEYDEAERLTTDATRLKANYGPFDAKPEGLLSKINAERNDTGAAVAATTRAAGAGAAMIDTAVMQASATVAQADATVDEAAVSAQRPATYARQAAAAARADNAAARSTAKAVRAAAPPTREQVLMMLAQARAAIAAGDMDTGERLARQAEAAHLPPSNFGPQDDAPWMVLLEVQRFRARNQGVVNADGAMPQGVNPYQATQAVYDPANDTTRVAQTGARSLDPASAGPPERLPPLAAAPVELSTAMRLFQEGEQALRDRDVPKARERFTQAFQLREQLDPVTAQRVQDHLQLLTIPSASQRAAAPKNLIDDASSRQTLLAKQLSAEVARQQIGARKLMESDPLKALEMMDTARGAVEAAGLDTEPRNLLLKRIEVSRAEIEKYIEQHRAQLDLDAQNKEVLSNVEAKRRKKLEIDERLAKMINDCNKLMEENRFGEAEVIAKRAAEIAPNNPITNQLMWNVKFAYRKFKNQQIIDQKEEDVMNAFYAVEEAAKPYDDRNPITMPDAHKWQQLTGIRSAAQRKAERNRRSDRDLDIERKLKTPVSLSFKNKPLSEALDALASLAAVNLYLDPQGLQAEAVDSSTPITIQLGQEVTLRSALKLILEPLHLSFVIKDEVLKITSEQLKDGEIYPVTYYVADLVVPIPNFTPNNRTGLQGALAEAMSLSTGATPAGFGGSSPTTVLASRDGSGGSGVINPMVAAQMGGAGSRGAGVQPGPYNPAGMGGGNQADFDSLIELLTTTISPTSWDEVGGPGSIAEFRSNLSLVISQTQEIHDQIADLLTQLRRLQDLQVTIEVRFITLNDNFFEQIGVDFNFNIENLDRSAINVAQSPTNPGATVGLSGYVPGPTLNAQGTPQFTQVLDIPFIDNSYSLATAPFGTPPAAGVASFGFAILSDIEAYFLVNASQGDRRSNVLQAPKVTLFNGQNATVTDASFSPFVITVIPVVGDFAAAQQPVIVVLSEGTFLTVQAVVSSDRRYVRLTLVPFFSQITNVQEFTFQGSSSSSANSSAGGGKDVAGDQSGSASNGNSTSTSGITVQLPTWSVVSVSTTVSVPDGGTVLLGGVKRLSEGRNEFGVPILSKLPYINRLFKNVGIGRETQSLMMMVTPRIIIEEEEEEILGIQPPGAAGP